MHASKSAIHDISGVVTIPDFSRRPAVASLPARFVGLTNAYAKP
jgi:hypothetical protein